MTTEEKARAYDKAFEKAKKKYNSKYHPSEGPSGVYLNNADLEDIFPELKESENERIGNIIYCIVRDNKEVKRILEDNGVSVDNALAYLEKQKDLAAIPDELVKNYKLFCENGRREVVVLINAINGISEQKEQKPAEIDEYEIIKKHITEDVLSSEVNKRLKECGWYVTGEKPSEWSEEDENIYNKALDVIYYKDLNDKDEVVDSLKALCDLIARKRKVIPPYAHWKPSEEQMNALYNVINPCDNVDKNALESLYKQLEKLI